MMIRMKSLKVLVFLSFSVLSAFGQGAKGGQVTVVDDVSGEPLCKANVFTQAGTILGMTDGLGRVYGVKEHDWPLTVKYLGYNTATATSAGETVRMAPVAYGLPEVVFKPTDRPVLRVRCYIRNYISNVAGTDTTIVYKEYWTDHYLPMQKVKHFKKSGDMKILSSRSYCRKAKQGRNDSVYVAKNGESASLPLSVLFDENPLGKMDVTEPSSFRHGAVTDSVMGKYGMRTLYRRNATSYITHTDLLSDRKSHRYKPSLLSLFGLTAEFTQYQTSFAYRVNNEGVYTPYDLLYGTVSLDLWATGKNWKHITGSDKPQLMKYYLEIYPAEYEALTVEEAKEYMKNPPALSRELPRDVLPLLPAIQQIVDRAR